MNVDEFESKFLNFSADFGYRIDGELNPEMQKLGLEELISTLSLSQSHERQYYVQLSWRTFTVGVYPCTETEYTDKVLPQAVITAAQNYKPPILERWIVVQETQEEGYYFLNAGKFHPDLDDAQEFSRQEADQQVQYWDAYWQENEHPPELTILGHIVTTTEQIQQIYQERERRWQAIVSQSQGE